MLNGCSDSTQNARSSPHVREKPVDDNEDSKDIKSASHHSLPDIIVDDDDYPEGGMRAWLVVLGSVCCTFATFGFVNSWGVFQSYYETDLLKNSSQSQIAWIGSIQYSFVFLPGQITGRMFDLGYFKVPFLCGTILLVISAILTAQCREYWHFLLCQGFLVGIASGICFGPALTAIGHWFKKRRGLALGITAAGSSLGGTVFPIAARHLIRVVGFPWTMRILGFMILLTLGIANITLARRLPPKNVPGGLLNMKAFKIPAFTLYCTANTIAFMGIYTVLTFIDISAVNVGVPEDFSFYLVSLVNAGGGVGRLLTGVMVDRWGAINVITPMTIAVSIMTFSWPYARSEGSFVAVGLLYGFTSAAYVSAFHIPLFAMGAIEDVGRRVGTVFVFAAVGSLLGPPISGAISVATGSTKIMSYYAGSTILLALSMMLLSRYLILGKMWGKF